MVRCYGKSLAFIAALVACGAVSCGALQLVSPTEGQAVREGVKITLPASSVPDSGFISVLIGETGAEKFVVALSRESAKSTNDGLTFFWNSKAPYFDATDPMKPRYFKDGRYALNVQVHDAKGVMVEKATLTIELKNRVPRTNPAPGVALANKLTFGQINEYRIRCDVAVFEMVNRIGLPLFGGMGLMADSVITQSVEDVRPGPEYLLRLRQDEKTYVSSYGVKSYLYADQELKPQLYRLVDSRGKVLKDNMFAKQAKYQIMDILPALPSQAVKEGDSWPDSMTLKIDGLTGLIKLKGSAMLDSFEWENGHECAKVTSMLAGDAPITLMNGKIQGAGPVNAEVVTYFAYKSGKMLLRTIRLTFDAAITATPEEMMGSAAPDVSRAPAPMPYSPYDDMDMPSYGSGRTPYNPGNTGTAHGSRGAVRQDQSRSGAKKGKVELNVVVRLEK